MQSVLDRVSSDNIRTVRFLYCDHGNVVRGKAAHAWHFAISSNLVSD